MGHDQPFKSKERYVVGWTDPRALYRPSPIDQKLQRVATVDRSLVLDIVGLCVGVVLIMVPIVVVAWLFWRWMGWL